MPITLYNVVSSDGFIATKDGKEDFIPDELWKEFLDICSKNDAVVISRKTYEAIQNYDQSHIDLFENLSVKRVVITENVNFKPKKGYGIAYSPLEALKFGSSLLVCSGNSLNDSFIKEGLADTVVMNVLPVVIKEGIKQFNKKPNMQLISEENFPDRKKLVYKVIK